MPEKPILGRVRLERMPRQNLNKKISSETMLKTDAPEAAVDRDEMEYIRRETAKKKPNTATGYSHLSR